MKAGFLILFAILVSLALQAQDKSYKRGIAYGYHSEADMQAASQGISWWYNWAAQPEKSVRDNYIDYNMDFTPMAWNGEGISGLEAFLPMDSKIRYILGFNEPNFQAQANMTPTQAAAAWGPLEDIADLHDLPLVSPAVNYCGSCVSENGTTYSSPFTYLDDFFSACAECRVDHIALHCYGGGNSIVGYIDEARKYGKPIWVTEFAAWDNSVNSPADQSKYLAGTVNFLERDPDVYRYSWFIGRTSGGPSTYPYLDLYGADGQLTPLGQLYIDIPVYDPEYAFPIPGRIEMEEYYLMKGIFAEPTDDIEGFMNIGWTDDGDWADYKIQVSETGLYKLHARYAGTNSGAMEFLVDGESAAVLQTPSTGGWQNWQTKSTAIHLDAGEHMLRMRVTDDGFNLNWLELEPATSGLSLVDIGNLDIFPNPVMNGSITIKVPDELIKEPIQIQLSNTSGRLIQRIHLPGGLSAQTIDLTSLTWISNGLYLLTLKSDHLTFRSSFVLSRNNN